MLMWVLTMMVQTRKSHNKAYPADPPACRSASRFPGSCMWDIAHEDLISILRQAEHPDQQKRCSPRKLHMSAVQAQRTLLAREKRKQVAGVQIRWAQHLSESHSPDSDCCSGQCLDLNLPNCWNSADPLRGARSLLIALSERETSALGSCRT